jgi:hypothetical protein
MKKEIIIVIVIGILLIGGSIIYKSYKPIKYFFSSCQNISLDYTKEQVKKIDNNLSSYTSTTKDIMNKSTEGGQQTDYVSNSSRVMIEQIFFGETGKSEISYYLSNHKVFYVRKVNTNYMVPLSEDPSGKVKNTEVKEFILSKSQELCSWYQDKVIQQNDQDAKDLLSYLVSGI